jgi:serine/threonine-protein kinase HipA
VALSTEVGLHSNELEDFAPAFEHDQMDEAQILLT